MYPDAPATVDEMINFVIDWIRQQPFYLNRQQPNYAVGVTETSVMIISKVGGVTSRTDGMAALVAAIQAQRWWKQLTGLFLAKTFGGDGGSNHGEMCVLAAADKMVEQLVAMKCTGDNCPACAVMLQEAGIRTMNATAAGSQSGWIHPRARMALGTQISNNWRGQLAELQQFNALSVDQQETFQYVLTRATGYDPEGGWEDVTGL